eukprot:GHVP01023815.1.p1 GENE.GHVP01023815.1~~GHVP01023815.1.p1  ORF type:complete len:258 (+),score=34.12 GHVP01023815.1:2858-3631(+)
MYCIEISSLQIFFINDNGDIAIADLGLARFIHIKKSNKFTPGVYTCWYRPPEILNGERYYHKSADIWAVGCLIAEILTGHVFIRGKSEINQLKLIENMFGVDLNAFYLSLKSKNNDMRDGLKRTVDGELKGSEGKGDDGRINNNLGNGETSNHLGNGETSNCLGNGETSNNLDKTEENADRKGNRQTTQKSKIDGLLEGLDEGAIDMIKRFLKINPDERISAKEALGHPYLNSEPYPGPQENFSSLLSVHEYELHNK